MVILTKKFSEFISGGDLANDEITVGLGSGTNVQYNNPWTFLPPGTTADRPTPAASMYYRLRLNTDLQAYEYYDPILVDWIQLQVSNNFEWELVTITPTQMASFHGYITNSVSRINLVLPLTSDVGDTIGISGLGSGGWIISQNAGQSIQLAPISTTIGVGGSLSSVQQFNSIFLLCIEANLTWTTLGGPQGTLNYV